MCFSLCKKAVLPERNFFSPPPYLLKDFIQTIRDVRRLTLPRTIERDRDRVRNDDERGTSRNTQVLKVIFPQRRVYNKKISSSVLFCVNCHSSNVTFHVFHVFAVLGGFGCRDVYREREREIEREQLKRSIEA